MPFGENPVKPRNHHFPGNSLIQQALADLVMDGNDTLYGTTALGGISGAGTGLAGLCAIAAANPAELSSAARSGCRLIASLGNRGFRLRGFLFGILVNSASRFTSQASRLYVLNQQGGRPILFS